MGDYVIKGVHRLTMQLELSDPVIGSVVEREVITINDGSDVYFS